MVRVPRTRWKPHKPKERTFLHRSYTPKKIPTSKKNWGRSIGFFSDQKSTKKNRHFLVTKIMIVEVRHFSILKIFADDFRKFSKTFFLSPNKKKFFSKLKIFLGYSFDVKNCVLFIYEVSRAFPAR